MDKNTDLHGNQIIYPNYIVNNQQWQMFDSVSPNLNYDSLGYVFGQVDVAEMMCGGFNMVLPLRGFC
jgi:hypothetical protein